MRLDGRESTLGSPEEVVTRVTDAGKGALLTGRANVEALPRSAVKIGAGRPAAIGLLTALALVVGVLAPLFLRSSVGAQEMVGGAEGTGRSVRYMWVLYAWFGIMLVLRPIAARFEIFRSYTEARFYRRMLMTAGISAAIVLILAWVIS